SLRARENRSLERSDILHQTFPWLAFHLDVTLKCVPRLLLEGGEARITLITARVIRAAREWVLTIRPRQNEVGDRGNSTPDIDFRFVRRIATSLIHKPHVRGQREGDSDEPVLAQICEVARAGAAGSEVVGICRPE